MKFDTVLLINCLWFCGGIAVCWFFKDKINGLILSVDTQVKAAEAKLAALKAKL